MGIILCRKCEKFTTTEKDRSWVGVEMLDNIIEILKRVQDDIELMARQDSAQW